ERSPEAGKQAPGALQVGGLEAFRERGIDGREQGTGLCGPASGRPQAGQGARGAQLERACLLSTRDLEGARQGRLRLGRRSTAGQQQLRAQVMELRVPPAFTRLATVRQGFL